MASFDNHYYIDLHLPKVEKGKRYFIGGNVRNMFGCGEIFSDEHPDLFNVNFAWFCEVAKEACFFFIPENEEDKEYFNALLIMYSGFTGENIMVNGYDPYRFGSESHPFSAIENGYGIRFNGGVYCPHFKGSNEKLADLITHGLARGSYATVIGTPATFKSRSVFSQVGSMDVVSPAHFDSADDRGGFGRNTICCTLRSAEQSGCFTDYNAFERRTWTDRYGALYDYVRSHPFRTYLNDYELQEIAKYSEDRLFVVPHWTGRNGVQDRGIDHDFNLDHKAGLKELFNAKQNKYMGDFAVFDTAEERDCFSRWWYNGKLADRMLLSLHKGTGVVFQNVIPGIDWKGVTSDEEFIRRTGLIYDGETDTFTDGKACS